MDIILWFCRRAAWGGIPTVASDRSQSLIRVIFLQSCVVLAVVAILGLLIGPRGAVSGLIGGLAYVLPNLLFVLRLKLTSASRQASVTGFMAGELLKLAATLAVIVCAQHWYNVHWLAMLVGLFAALKANLFAFLLKT